MSNCEIGYLTEGVNGNEQLAQEGIPSVRLMVGKADELDQFQNSSFDIVFTNALLIYAGPDKIR